MRHLLAFDAPQRTPDGYGGQVIAWAEQFKSWGQLIYQRGGEDAIAGAQAVTASFKVKIPTCIAARELTGEYRMRTVNTGFPAGEGDDLLPGQRYNLRQVDALSDRNHVWVVAESGVSI
jgi:head-tail adaptor